MQVTAETHAYDMNLRSCSGDDEACEVPLYPRRLVS